MRLSKCFLVSFTYIGGVIGAGFATGREVMLYFGEYGLLSALIGGVLMGLLAGVFLWSGKYFMLFRKCDKKWTKTAYVIIKVLLYLSIYATFLCMISACEEIISEGFGVKNAGLWTGIFVAFLGVLDMGVMQKFNLAIVPVIVVLLLVLASKSISPQLGRFSAMAVVSYAGMNIMTGGYLLAEQDKPFSIRECIFVSVLTALVFAGALALVYGVSVKYKNFSMPIYEFAKIHDFKGVSGLVIYLAIFTTLIGCSKLICQENDSIKIPKAISISMLILTTFIGIKLDFAKAVGIIYPIVGYVGVGYLVFMLILPLFKNLYSQKTEEKEDKSKLKLSNKSVGLNKNSTSLSVLKNSVQKKIN